MEDESYLRGERTGAVGVVTLALVVGAAQSPAAGMVMAYARPSDGIRAAVAAVAEARGQANAAVTTAEMRDEKTIASRLRGMVAVMAGGSVVVSLAAQELARAYLEPEYRFEDLGTHAVTEEDDLERLFLVRHPLLEQEIERVTEAHELKHADGFIGRTAELDEIIHRLDRTRIVTVVGPSGIGKSALIRRYVAEHGDEFLDGVLELDLSSVAQPALVLPMMLRLSGAVRLPGETIPDALTAHLRDRRMLVVLDNADAVLPEVRRIVASLVQNAPQVAILVGSQRAMRLPGEARVKVGGLETPVGPENWQAIQDYDAVALFLDRAQLVDDQFRLTRENAPIIARLCQRLDGIPLAIEMAAAKVNVLSPKQILNRLDDRFLLLTDPSPGRPDRHRTLRATIDWGHDQLRPEARILLRRLAPFAGAFSIDEAAEVVVDEKLAFSSLYTAFEEVVEASLLTPSSVGGPEKRFYLTETVRLYAKERLKAEGEDREFIARHRAWCLELARRGQPGLQGSDQLDWLHRIDGSYEDLRQAIEGETSHRGDLETAMEILLAIYPYFLHRTYHSEGLRLCERVLAPKAARHKPQHARVLNLAAALCMRMGDMRNARCYATRSYLAARRRGDAIVGATARSSLGAVAQETVRPQRARRHFLSAANIFRSAGETGRLLNVLVNLVATEVDLKLSSAREHLHEAEALLRRHPNPVLEAYLHLNWAHLELSDGNPTRALEMTRLAAEFFVASRDQKATATAWRNAAYALERLDRYQAAAYFLGAARRLARGDEFHLQPTYEQGWRDLIERVRSALGRSYVALEMEGHLSDDEEVLERIQYETGI